MLQQHCGSASTMPAACCVGDVSPHQTILVVGTAKGVATPESTGVRAFMQVRKYMVKL